ncbi:MAG: fibronectin type III domain-containing protein, partial [Bacteroidales bacterium]|nr:fibronectin type III domain-containing protein [Bacteroidales bacterium]
KVCSATDTSNLSDGILFTTECDAITMPYAQNFDGVTTTQSTYTGVLPNCWTIAAIDASSMSTSNMPQIYWNSTSTYSTSGQYSLHMYYRGILALPESAVPVDSLQMTFNLKQTASSYQLVVGVLDSITPGCEASFTAIDTLVCSSTSNFEPFTVYFSNYAGTGRYIAFRNHNTNGYDYSYNYIDDVVIDYTPSCLPVLNVHGDLSLATSSSITLDWTDLGTPAGQYEVQYGNADFTLGQGTSIYVTSHPTVIGGLQPVSNYKFYVRPICSAGDTAIWSQPGIAATGMCDGAIFDTIGTESNTAYQYPVNNYYRYTQSQTIYTVADLDSMAKTLNGIMYQYGYTSPSTTKTDVSIYLSHTNKDAFSNSSDFINIDSTFVLVYQGDLNASMGWNRYAFSQEFQYNGTDNLLVTVIDNSGAYNNSSYVWNTSACNGSMTIVGYSDTYAPTTSNLTGYSGTKAAYSYRVNTMFISCGGAAVCRTPVVASVSNIDYQSATINWTGTGTNYEVEVKPTSQGIWNDQPT